MSAACASDYKEWTRYSLGNPHAWRRLYRGHLLWAHDGTHGSSPLWNIGSGNDFRVFPAQSFAEAKAAAEHWAEEQP